MTSCWLLPVVILALFSRDVAGDEPSSDEVGKGSYFTINSDLPAPNKNVWVLTNASRDGGKFCMLVLTKEPALGSVVRKDTRHLNIKCVERGPSQARNSHQVVSPRMYTKYVLTDAEVGMVICDYEYGPRHLTVAEIVEAASPAVTFKAYGVKYAGQIRSCSDAVTIEKTPFLVPPPRTMDRDSLELRR